MLFVFDIISGYTETKESPSSGLKLLPAFHVLRNLGIKTILSDLVQTFGLVYAPMVTPFAT